MINSSEILLTVLMPVYNGGKYLSLAINSIIHQTYSNLEFLIINDGSSDHSEKIINSFTDPRIRYIKNDSNKGIVNTLNIGLEMSRGRYIARMDADDIAHPQRLEMQLNFMLSHPECKLCGTMAIAINESGSEGSKLRRPIFNNKIKVEQLFRNSFIHPSVLLDAHVARTYKYSSNFEYAEDFYLFSQIALNHEVANLPDTLLYYRIHSENITSKKQEEMTHSEMKTMNYLLSNLLGTEASAETVSIHHRFLTRSFENIDLNKMESHLLKIKHVNQVNHIYEEKLLSAMLQKEWFNFLYFGKEKNALRKYLGSALFSVKHFNFRQFIKLTIKK